MWAAPASRCRRGRSSPSPRVATGYTCTPLAADSSGTGWTPPRDVLTPLVFNRPVERYFLPKAIGVGLVWGASMLMRFVLF